MNGGLHRPELLQFDCANIDQVAHFFANDLSAMPRQIDLHIDHQDCFGLSAIVALLQIKSTTSLLVG